ncbi:hypothetical protein [[Limnothrix rosea] IAM M-220]|uniref:hypothetical protein n=1 Tax=[Limnothrix rosea] IAM M-220 TaxID=454133 RepID=UPI00096A11C1|nr:hypothetical protein [[Limnothrix rosea] IAM M-220]OKH11503.1 hypothetical protein NIES208_17245 [[Limnothrix rosea] IAM M-220]
MKFPDNYNTEFRQEAERLTQLLQNSQKGFSYLRMGDLELAFMVHFQEGNPLKFDLEMDNLSENTMKNWCHPGITLEDYPKLLEAYEKCDYLDDQSYFDVSSEKLNRLTLNRAENTDKNPSDKCSHVFFPWVFYEFKEFTRHRKCLFVGAESAIFKELFQTPAYRELARDFIAEDVDFYFYQPPEDGRNVSKNQTQIYQEIKQIILEQQIDTAFISLGGISKIIGYHLSQELQVKVFDFGSMMRAFTYSGSDGNTFHQSPHHPFLFYLPFDLYMNALEKAHPYFSEEQIFAKALTQLGRDLIDPIAGWSNSNVSLTPENIQRFQQDKLAFTTRYGKLLENPECKKLYQNFDAWLLSQGYGVRGKLFLLKQRANKFVQKVQNKLQSIFFKQD